MKHQVGVFPNLSFEEYVAAPGINQSSLKDIAVSPKNFWAMHIDPDRPERKDTKAFRQGRQIHCALLERDLFQASFIRALNPAKYPDAPRTVEQIKARLAELGVEIKSKDKKDDLVAKLAAVEIDPDRHAFDSIAERHLLSAQGKTVLSLVEWEQCVRAVETFDEHPVAQTLIESGQPEVSMFWVDSETGEECKARIDWRIGTSEGVLDIKSVEDASIEAFTKSIANYEYHVQAAYYLDGFAAATGLNAAPESYVFGAIEKVRPFDVAFYYADPEMLEEGRKEYRRRLALYSECRKTNEWPGYPREIRRVSLPKWALKRIDHV